MEGIWVFALVCLDIQEICKLFVLLESVGSVFFPAMIILDISLFYQGDFVFTMLSAFY